ncbi:inactive dipeptidyl peptidase 10-like [Erpetoichthys calabaricus]|uniref:inactive dipeptidyl peptidase 10-like n=1 Tax=Erpetoichthys calabaricus TaxID=27687 RepID=UPI002234357E|nr:inactive dipeptidyl peptidase 10-like [Erpetoichthys calabaricus]
MEPIDATACESVTKVYRYSYMASYSIYNLHTREVWELNPPEVTNSVLQYAAWGVQGQQLVYIFENNIYYQPDVRNSSLRLTDSGKEGAVFNGIADWLYEEEILHSHVAHWWSPDGRRLAFLMINDSLVPRVVLPRFTGVLYPSGYTYPYPKAGQTNPSVKLYVVKVQGLADTVELRPPASFKSSDYYITMVKWINSNKTAVRWLDRNQKSSLLAVCEVTTGDCVKKHERTSKFFLTMQNEEPLFSNDGNTFFMILPEQQQDKGEFHHISVFFHEPETEEINVQILTSGQWEVTEILAYDENQKDVYVLSTENSLHQRQLYRVSYVGTFTRQCLTCNIFKDKCTYFSAEFSSDLQYVILNCQGPGVPKVTLHRLSDMEISSTLEDNANFRDFMTKRVLMKDLTTVSFDGYAFPLQLTLPANFNEKDQYPLLLMTDEAPGSQSITEKFHLDWDSVLSSSDGVIVAQFDSSGSGFQGLNIMRQIYQRVGVLEVHDYLKAIQHLFTLPFIDNRRTAIYGKAYGGFLSTRLFFSSESPLKCTVAVAPITDWHLYSSAFTERYFGLPLENIHTYRVCSPQQNVTAMNERKFLLVHGTADAKVHFQHSAELITKLTQCNMSYTFQMYPDEGHDITLIKSRYYFYNTLITFLRQCFHAELPSESHFSEE